MKDDAPLCGCGPCRQSALGALRSDIARDEMYLRRDMNCLRIIQEAVDAGMESDDRLDMERHLASLRMQIDLCEGRLAANRALEGWLAANEHHMPRNVDEALWRYIVDSPNGGF